MSYLPVISGAECIRILGKIGFFIRRQSGSHIILRRDDTYTQVTVPNHKTLDRGTLFNIIRSAELSVNEFKELM
ncbi:MAG: type II toxin-antitoxin system HicA family toxin [Candidatus Kapabacteria bacterium]|nr:type II toxin-antitoxin system HicA family toxin [Candidatus Kapabacteria bacterium]